jgi:hypothetical protein
MLAVDGYINFFSTPFTEAQSCNLGHQLFTPFKINRAEVAAPALQRLIVFVYVDQSFNDASTIT